MNSLRLVNLSGDLKWQLLLTSPSVFTNLKPVLLGGVKAWDQLEGFLCL